MGRHLDQLRRRLYLRPEQELLSSPAQQQAARRDAAEAGPHGRLRALVHDLEDAERNRDVIAAERSWLMRWLAQHSAAEPDAVLHYDHPDGGRQSGIKAHFAADADRLAKSLERCEWVLAEAHRRIDLEIEDADRRRRLEAEQAARALPRRAEDIAARIAG